MLSAIYAVSFMQSDIYSKCQLYWMSFVLSIANKNFMLSAIMLSVVILHMKKTLWVVTSFKSNLLLMSFCLHIINYNS